jgi:hypothetical protein
MSLALIEESAKEVRRLAIAGSSLAPGDFRLKKLIAPLEQAGAKVPVFAQVAKAVADVVDGPESDSANRLLNLSTLLNAVLYTQGSSGAGGDVRELEAAATNCASTKTTARVLKPLIQALTASGSGRFELIKTAAEQGAFKDLRLISPSIQALGDGFPEIADLVAEKILPAFGPGIIPQLKVSLDIKGKKHDARKLAVMHQLDPAGTVELCKTALEDGSAEIKCAAIACLGRHEDCLPLVLEQANAKNKQVRAAALEALAEHDRPEVTKLFTELVKGKALDILAGPFRELRNQQVLNSLLDEGKRVFDLILDGDSEQIPRFSEVLGCLEPRREAEVQDFLLGAFMKSDALGKVKAPKNAAVTPGVPRVIAGQMVLSGTDLMLNIAMLLYGMGSKQTLEAILGKREVLSATAFSLVFRSALRSWPAEKVFAEFSPLLEHARGAGKARGDEVERFICVQHRDETAHFDPLSGGAAATEEQEALKQVTWDPRWLDAAIKANRPAIVCCLAKADHKTCVDYLVKLGDAKQPFDAGATARALVRCGYPKITDFFLNQVGRKTRGAKYPDYELQSLFQSAQFLPKADLPRLDAFAAELDEKFMDPFLEAIAPLRSASTEL